MAGQASVRSAESRDVSGITAILEATQLFPADLLAPMMAGYLDRSNRDIWFVAEERDRVVAFGYCEPERMTEGTWNLLAIGVLPDRQGSGVGSGMMRYLEELLAADGERILLVETMGVPEFERTRRFYRNNGYIEEARIREFYEPGADKIVFWKHLQAGLNSASDSAVR